METLLEYVERSRTINREVVRYLMGLFQKSARKPDLVAEEDFEEMEDFFSYHIGWYEWFKEQRPLEEFERLKKFPFVELIEAQVPDESGEQFESKVRVFQQDSEINVITEMVANRKGDDWNIPVSTLILSNLEARTTLFLDALLPKEFTFVPERVAPVFHKEYDEIAEKIVNRTERRSLEDYNGSHQECRPKSLWANFTSKWVAYGNLTKKGEFLSLLHEVVHAWQSSFYSVYPGEEFKVMVTHVPVWAEMVCDYMGRLNGSDEECREAQFCIEWAGERMFKKGLRFHPLACFSFGFPSSYYQKVGISNATNGYLFYVGRETVFEDILKRYEESERYAWAYGMRVIRFLRKKGIDLEPEMKTLQDFRDWYEPKLATYDVSSSFNVYWPDRPMRFVRNRRKSSE